MAREGVSSVLKQLAWKTLYATLTNPRHFTSTHFTFEHDKSECGFRIVRGLSRVNGRVMECGEGVVVADVSGRELLAVEGVDLVGVKHNAIVDLSCEGDRWEGCVLDARPCGWGVLYDRDNRRVYEGFRVGERNVCYGREYYSDIDRVRYEGGWCCGVRWGRGVVCDRSGGVVFEGEWLNDERLCTSATVESEGELLHNHIEELVVDVQCCNGEEWRVLDLGVMRSLKAVYVCDDCFRNVEEVRMTGMRELESVRIGERSFTRRKNDFGNNPDRRFCVKDCPSLRELSIGCHSFSDYSVMEMESVDGLERIDVGEVNSNSYNFYYASLELKSATLFDR